MPTVLFYGPYRFYFFSHENNEPPHIHVDREYMSAKFWFNPISLASNQGFSAKEINKLFRIIEENQQLMLESWNEHFSL
jgi:hypothetical protein